METIYKYGSILGVSLILVIGAYFYGHHEGSLAGTAEVSALRAQIATQTDAAVTRGAQEQKQADDAALAVAEQAVKDANASAAAHSNDLQSAHAAISRLQSEVSAYAKGSVESKWLLESIPHDIGGSMCLYTGSPPTFNRACSGGSVHPDSAGGP